MRILHGSVGVRREFPLSDNFFIVKKNNLRNFVYICSPERMINVAPDGAGRRGDKVCKMFRLFLRGKGAIVLMQVWL